MALLDELSGFEFEDTMEIVFTKLGYENVRQSRKTADEGRDIIMEESNPNGPPTAVIVECKHTGHVGRPVVQKLDSAVKTYDHNGPKRGLIATTGRFSQPAQEYADRVNIELLDGHDLRDIADEIGMDLYNGRVEILCDEMLSPFHPDGVTAPLIEQFERVNNITSEELPEPDTTLTLYPVVKTETHLAETFETGAGVIHQIDHRERLLLDASRDGPQLLDDPVKTLVTVHGSNIISTDAVGLNDYFDTVVDRRFGMTETEFRDWIKDREVERHTEVVTYTGDNNVTYNKECEPSPSHVTINSFTPVYAPRIYASVDLGEYTYAVDWFAADEHAAIVDNDVTGCVHCDGTGDVAVDISLATLLGVVSRNILSPKYTYCGECGAIACQEHTRVDALTGDVVCAACSVTARFAGAKKHFASETNRDTYAAAYQDASLAGKARENIPAIITTVFLVLSLLILVL